ncbi:ankyrin repeat domain-containing T4SS effector AnkF, partial [Coxiella burnetii]
ALRRTEYGIPLAIAAARNFQPIVDYFWEQGVPYLEEEKRNNRGFQR